MAAKKKTPALQKFVLVALVLIVCEIGFLVFFKTKTQSVTFMDAVKEELSKKGDLSLRRKEQAKIQMAVINFQGSNGGKLPTSLDELRPKYFEQIPIDPDTQKPFEYKVINGKFFVGSDESAPSEEEAKPIAKNDPAAKVPAAEATEITFVYDPAGKRDPFRPVDFAPKIDTEGKTPLEKYELGQFKLTAVLKDAEEPTGIVELPGGKGFTVKKGAKIGLHGGEVVEILPNKMVIVESYVDFTGEKTSKTVDMPLRTKDQDGKQP